MAKRKTKAKAKKPAKKKRIRRRPQPAKLGRYILAALFVIFLMWIIIREPQAAPQDLEKIAEKSPAKAKSVAAQSSEPQKSKKPRKSRAAKKTAKKEIEPKKSEPVPGKSEVKIVEAELIESADEKIVNAITKTANSLGVPQQALKRRKNKELLTYSIPIDRSQMDLIYANMIFKGNLEQAGATLLKGEDSRNRQILSYYHKNSENKYQLELYYDSRHYKDKSEDKKISIVVDDFGTIGGKLLDDFLKVDTAVCFAIFPRETHSLSTMQRAHAQGRETLIHVPMEPIGYPSVNPGKDAILVQHTAAQIDKLLSAFIAELPLTMGINNHMGSFATSDADVMKAVMQSLKKHNKAFLDSRTTNVSVAYQTAQKAHLRAYRNDLFLDSPNISQSNMDSKLNQIIQLSNGKKHVIAITHCHNREKLDYLNSFIARLKKAGFTLVPLSEYGSQEVPEIL